MALQTKPISGYQLHGRDEMLRASARLLAEDLPLAELFSKLAVLLEKLFGTAIVEIQLNSKGSEVYRYGDEPAAESAASITLPLIFHTETLGHLHIVQKSSRPFSRNDIEALETCALYIAIRLFQAELTTAKEHSEALAGIDPLTGVSSRRDFNAHYESEWTRGMRHGGLLSVLMIDVDHFKAFNDQYGHIAGDACLQKIAKTLKQCAGRAGDVVARYGGEEFALVLPLTDHAGAIATAERIRSAIASQRIEHEGSPINIVTVSVGVATEAPLRSASSADLIDRADKALYSAKRAGRNAVFGAEYQTDAAETGRPPVRSNLPVHPAPFFGRVAELDAIEYLFTQTRCLTVTGTAGIGKTRAALQFAGTALQQYPDGVWFVDIARVTDAALVVGSVIFVLGDSEEQSQQPLATLINCVGDKAMLIVLDNCQRLIEECAAMVEAMLRKCPNLRVVATSRQQLGIGGEIAYRIPALALHDSADLFESRAAALNSEFHPSGETRPLVERIVSRLDGIPMAIELAAARIKVMSASDLDLRLEDRFPVTAPGSSSSPRPQILPNLVDWSYEVLDKQEQQLLRRLSIFPGDWEAEAAADICKKEEKDEQSQADVLRRLVDKALILREPHGRTQRYSMFETLREYGRALMHELRQFDYLQRRHALYFRKVAEALERDCIEPPTSAWLESFEVEQHNFRAALEWSVLAGGDLPTGAAIATALARWWTATSHFHEGRYWIDHIIWRANEANIAPDLRAKLLDAAGQVASRQFNGSSAATPVMAGRSGGG
jgi:diguanylate cyclase (GGDEF)-like protein